MLRYICISDVHAGGLTSLVGGAPGADPEKGAESPVTSHFCAALEAFLGCLATPCDPRPQLILLGDILDLQFATRSRATQDALAFLRGLYETGQFHDTVLATAGNHDHALWADARLGLEAAAFAADDPQTRHSTPAFTPTPTAQSRLLSAVVQRAGFDGVDLRYPNIGFQQDSQIVLLHHGHYIEPAYRLMSLLKDALMTQRLDLTIEKLAAENAAWIDFAWSAFDDADRLELLYQNFLTTTGFRRISSRWSAEAARVLSETLPLSGNRTVQQLLSTATKTVMDATLGRVRDTERMAEVTALTRSGLDGLNWYLEGPVLRQIAQEKPNFEGDVTFVMGHTHRPFSMRVKAAGYDTPVRVHNSGGWTLNGPRLDNAEGACVILIDDALNTAALRLFSTPKNGTMDAVHIEVLSNDNDSEHAFAKQLRTALTQTKDQWAALSDAARLAYFARQRLLLEATDPDVPPAMAAQ